MIIPALILLFNYKAFLFPKSKPMALKITTDCIVCHACLPECPNQAIYEPGVEWAMSDGTSLKGDVLLMTGTTVDASARQQPINNEYYYIVPDKCTECQGFHEEPQCAAACPTDACVPDEMYQETVDQLMAKKEKLHM
jgi:ferredoxin